VQIFPAGNTLLQPPNRPVATAQDRDK